MPTGRWVSFFMHVLFKFLKKTACAAILGSVGLTLPVLAQDPPAPTFTNVTVHDPSVIKVGARWYVYGSHGASAWTEDLMNWTQVATSVTSGNPAHFNTFQSELSELIAWTGATTLWAPDVIRLADGKFHYFYDVWTDLQGYRSYMGQAVADGIEGPYIDAGELLRGGTGVAGFNPAVHPNTIDPNVFYDQAGVLWMVYGSYSGGIFILQLDQTAGSPTIGQPLPGQGYGTKLLGGNHANIEGAYIIYSPESHYYYLFTSFAGLAANGGYNMRVFRSVNANGPYFDAAGNNMATTSIPNSNLSTIAPYGVKIMGNCQFQTVAGENGTALPGYVSPGHNSVYYDPATDKYFLVFHTRFVGLGEQHQVRVHQMFVNSDGWFVVSPHRYANETIAPTNAGRIVGNYKLINHGKDITATVKNSTAITLAANGTVSGSDTGTWQLTGDYDVTLTLGSSTYRGVFVRQWDESRSQWLLAFTAVDNTGVSIWGSKVAINTAPAVLTNPAGQTVTTGANVTFTAMVSGDPLPAYQWKKDGVNISGATNSSYSLANVTTGDAASYTLFASNSAGNTTSTAATLTVNVSTVAPAITTQPVSQTVNAGDSVTFTAAASGNPTPTYQWRKNGVDISGATGTSYTINGVAAGNAGNYTVLATNAVGSDLSAAAVLTVIVPPSNAILTITVE